MIAASNTDAERNTLWNEDLQDGKVIAGRSHRQPTSRGCWP